MYSIKQRVSTFLFLCVLSFCATISPAYALVTSFAGLPSINAIINGTIGTITDFSGGVNIARTAAVVIDGVSIPFTVAEVVTGAEVATGVAAAGLAVPLGIAAGVIIAAALLYGWHKCQQGTSGWCKTGGGDIYSGGWAADDGNYTSLDTAIDQHLAAIGRTQYSLGGSSYTGTNAACVPGAYNGQRCSSGYAHVRYNPTGTTATSTGVYYDIWHYENVGVATVSTEIAQATDPVHAIEAKSLVERAMAENKLLPSVAAQAAQSDGHPVDDPKVNPQLKPTIQATPSTTAPTHTETTGPDGTKTSIDCTGTASVGVTAGDISTASLTKSGGNTCVTVVTAPNGTTTTSTSSTTTAPTQAPPATGPIECGSPGRAKCAIDETGTPTATPTDVDLSKHKETYDTATTSITSVTNDSIGISGWLPKIATTECSNPQVPNPITKAMTDVPICGAFNTLKTFISAVICVFALYGCIREVQSALKA